MVGKLDKTKKMRSVQMDADEWDKLDAIAHTLGCPTAQVVRKWLRQKLKEYETETNKTQSPL